MSMRMIYKIGLFFVNIVHNILHNARICIYKAIEWCNSKC